jgi:hypothetical protein
MYSPPIVTVQPRPNTFYDDASRDRARWEPQTPQFGAGVNNDTNNTGAQVPGGSAGATSLDGSRQIGVTEYGATTNQWHYRS